MSMHRPAAGAGLNLGVEGRERVLSRQLKAGLAVHLPCCPPARREYVEPSMIRNGKCVALAYATCGHPRANTEIRPAPSG